jgi:hypothetical protein
MKKNGMRPVPRVKFSMGSFEPLGLDGKRAREGDRGAA